MKGLSHNSPFLVIPELTSRYRFFPLVNDIYQILAADGIWRLHKEEHTIDQVKVLRFSFR